MPSNVSIGQLAEDLATASVDDSADHSLIVVAGQALAFWGGYYLARDDHAQPALSSLDIDFFQRRLSRVQETFRAMEDVARYHGFELDALQPSSTNDHASVSTAITAIKSASLLNPIKVDFLLQVAGLDTNEILSGALKISVGETWFWVLNPCLCLKARIHNLLFLYPMLGKSPEKQAIELRRVHAAVRIVSHYLQDLQASNDDRAKKALKGWVQKIMNWSRAAKIGKRLAVTHGVDLLDALEGLALDDRFRERTVEPQRAKLKSLFEAAIGRWAK